MEEEVLKGKTLLVVDDETDLRDIVASELEFLGASTLQAENITKALEILQKQKIDLVISDIRMPGGTGIDLLDSIKQQNATTPSVILITGFADITLEDALHKGAEALVNKPFKLDDLIRLVMRFTAPLEERFQEEASSIKKLFLKTEGDHIHFGRGGGAVLLGQEYPKIEQGDVVQVEFPFKGKAFTAKAVCRWVKSAQGQPQDCIVGLEFLSLSSESLKTFLQLLQDQKIVSYIPSA